jgi:cytochrome c biogenesis factor
MPEFLVLCFLLIPQIVAGIYAKSLGKNFWFWFFISFVIPILSLVVLLFLDKNKGTKKGYQLADHVTREKL